MTTQSSSEITSGHSMAKGIPPILPHPQHVSSLFSIPGYAMMLVREWSALMMASYTATTATTTTATATGTLRILNARHHPTKDPLITLIPPCSIPTLDCIMIGLVNVILGLGRDETDVLSHQASSAMISVFMSPSNPTPSSSATPSPIPREENLEKSASSSNHKRRSSRGRVSESKNIVATHLYQTFSDASLHYHTSFPQRTCLPWLFKTSCRRESSSSHPTESDNSSLRTSNPSPPSSNDIMHEEKNEPACLMWERINVTKSNTPIHSDTFDLVALAVFIVEDELAMSNCVDMIKRLKETHSTQPQPQIIIVHQFDLSEATKATCFASFNTELMFMQPEPLDLAVSLRELVIDHHESPNALKTIHPTPYTERLRKIRDSPSSSTGYPGKDAIMGILEQIEKCQREFGVFCSETLARIAYCWHIAKTQSDYEELLQYHKSTIPAKRSLLTEKAKNIIRCIESQNTESTILILVRGSVTKNALLHLFEAYILPKSQWAIITQFKHQQNGPASSSIYIATPKEAQSSLESIRFDACLCIESIQSQAKYDFYHKIASQIDVQYFITFQSGDVGRFFGEDRTIYSGSMISMGTLSTKMVRIPVTLTDERTAQALMYMEWAMGGGYANRNRKVEKYVSAFGKLEPAFSFEYTLIGHGNSHISLRALESQRHWNCFEHITPSLLSDNANRGSDGGMSETEGIACLTPETWAVMAFCYLPVCCENSDIPIQFLKVFGRPKMTARLASSSLNAELLRLLNFLPIPQAKSSVADANASGDKFGLNLYPKKVASVFANDGQWDILKYTRVNVKYEFFVTIIHFDSKIDAYSAKYGKFDDTFPTAGKACPRTLALLTRRPIPTHLIPLFCVYPAGDTKSMVELLHWNSGDDHAKFGIGSSNPALSIPNYKYTSFSAAEIDLIKKFQEFFWGLFKAKLQGIKLSGDAAAAAAISGDHHDPRMLLLAPMIGVESSKSRLSWDIDYSLLLEVSKKDKGVDLHAWMTVAGTHLQRSKIPALKKSKLYDDDNSVPFGPFDSAFDNIYAAAQEIDVTSCPVDLFSEEMANILAMTVVTTPHNYACYRVSNFLPGMSANSAFDCEKKSSRTYREFVQSQGYTLRSGSDSLPLIEAALFRKEFSMLQPCLLSMPTTHGVHLVSDICKIMPFPAAFLRLCIIFPCIFYRIDSICSVIDFSANLNIPHVRTSNLYTALTACSSQEPFNYERLEFIGDSFIKMAVATDLYLRYPAADEGKLGGIISKKVSNVFLAELASKAGLPSYIITEIYQSKYCQIPRLPWLPPCDPRLNTAAGFWTRCLPTKTVADCFEAVVGACAVDGTEADTYNLLLRFGLVKHPTGLMAAKDDSQDSNDSAHNSPTVQGSLEDAVLSDQVFQISAHSKEYVAMDLDSCSMPVSIDSTSDCSYEALERRLGYTFRNPTLLEESLAHISRPCRGWTYERLEFLGDAVLDWIVARYIYDTYPNEQPGSLTHLKHAAVNAEAFNRLAVALGLHKLLRHNSAGLASEIRSYVDHLSGLDQFTTHPLEATFIGPKELGDVFESLTGAVFIDCDGDLRTVRAVFHPIIIPFLSSQVTPTKVRLNPIERLGTFLSSIGVDGNELDYRFDEYSHACELWVRGKRLATCTEANGPLGAKRGVCVAALKVLHEDASFLSDSRGK